MTENENDEATKQTVKHLHSECKARILQLAKGGDPKLVQKIFNDFDHNNTGTLTIDEVTNMIAKLRISVERKYVYPFFKTVDADNSGAIEYPEWQAYVLGN